MKLLRMGPAALLVTTLGLTAWAWWPSAQHGGNVDGADVREAVEAPPGLTSVIVDFKDDLSAEALASNAWQEEPLSRFSSQDRVYRVRFGSAGDAADALNAMRRDATVESADWDVEVSLSPDEIAAANREAASECAVMVKGDDTGPAHQGFPNDPCFRYQWHLSQIGLPTAWKAGQGSGAVVAVIDTGVTKVPDLGGIEFVPGYNFVADNQDASDDHGHGTHVAGTIAQATNNRLGVSGVAFGAKIMPLKVLSARGSGSMGAIAQSIRWAADHGANVINMSLGGPFPVGTIKSAVEYARNKGVIVVAAAGNDGKGRVSYPAKYPGVVAVASTQFDETTTFYSNWGREIDVAAPGGNVRVDQNGDGKPDGVLQNTVVPGDISRTDYLFFMGTSMASPHVAGVAALLVGAGVTRPEAVEALLLETARRPKGVTGGKAGRVNDHYGSGIVDANAALKKAKVGRGASSLGIAGALGLVGVLGLRRRGRLGAGVSPGFAAALVAGASGLFFLPALFGVPDALSFVTVGATELLPALTGLGAGNPLLLSAALPLLGIGLFLGVNRLRSTLAGFAFGVAGALAFAALAYVVDVKFVPDLLDRAWLAGNAALAYLLGVSALRR